MFAVALFTLASSPEVEAQALALDLGTTAYEERLRLVCPLPILVRTFADRSEALELLRRLRARGHGAVGCDGSAVQSAASLVPVRGFAFTPDALELSGAPEARSLRYDDLLAVVRARHRGEVRAKTEVKTKSFSAGRALLSGGLMLRKETKRQEESLSVSDEQVLYLFRRSGETPWLLRERGAHYGSLGQALHPSSLQNFLATLAELRGRAPHAVYDEQLLLARRIPGQVRSHGPSGSEVQSRSDTDGVDLLAHLTALWLSRRVP